MRDHTIGAVYDLIRHIDQEVGTLALTLSDRDVTVRVVTQERDPARTTVSEVMTAMPMAILESSSIESALGMIGRFRRMPVVNGPGELVGIVTLDDILTLLAEEFSMVGVRLERESSHRAA